MYVNLKKLGANIKRFRAEAGVSQTDLGWMIGKPQQRVSGWENGSHAMSIEVFAMICEALQVDPNKLLEDECPENMHRSGQKGYPCGQQSCWVTIHLDRIEELKHEAETF